MNHEIVPTPCKSVDRLLNSSPLHFGLHQGKKCQSKHGGRGLQKTYSKAYINHWHSPTHFAMEEAKEVLLWKKTRAHGKEIL